MNDEYGETLSRLMDGDEVDAALLASALESPEARRTLVEFAELRCRARSGAPPPDPGFQRATLDMLRATNASAPRGISYRLAAALVLAAGLFGFGFDMWRQAHLDLPPAAARALRFEASEWQANPGGGL
jgi:hypothetical protein